MKIDEILEKSGLNTYNAQVTPVEFEIISKYLDEQPDKSRMLEIGTGAGHSTTVFAMYKPNWLIYTIDGYWFSGIALPFPADLTNMKESHDRWNNMNIKNIISITGNSKDIPWELSVNVIFIDGDHSYKGFKNDFEKYSPFLEKSGVIICHDAGRILDYLNEIKDNWKLIIENNIAIIKWIK